MSTLAQRSWLIGISMLAVAGFSWPFFLPAIASSSEFSSGWMAIAALPVLVIAALALLQGQIAGPRQIAMLAVLSSLAAATRIATSGVGGFELIFVVIILGSAAVGGSFGFLLGAFSILLSSLFFGGFGPWTAFQMFAVGWVGLGAGFLGSRITKHRLWLLAAYGFVASYGFGLVMNLWFWPFAVGPETSLSYRAGADLQENLYSFLSYSLVSSTLTWDTLRALSTAAVILLLGKPVLTTLARYKA